jgi:hypothetical protein
MPLVRIETRHWMTKEIKRAVLDAAHDALVATFKIPDHDRNQSIIEYDPDNSPILNMLPSYGSKTL